MKERGEDIGPSRTTLKKNRMVDSACRLRIVIDCSFDDFMTEKVLESFIYFILFMYLGRYAGIVSWVRRELTRLCVRGGEWSSLRP